MGSPDRVDREALKQAPHEIIELTTTDKFSFPRDDLEDIHLAALKTRFNEMSQTVPVLRRFAEEQGLSEIRTLEDGAMLLLPHTMYKSYPSTAIENGRFDLMTKWLGSLTALDLSSAIGAKCRDIDEWIDLLDARTQVRLRHSSGTTGKLSFFPQSVAEAHVAAMGFKRYFEGFGDEPDAGIAGVGELPIICFFHRKGAMGQARMMDAVIERFYGGDESNIVFLNPGRLSADMLSLGGRLEGAAAKGEQGRTTLSPELLARREEFIREQANAPKHQQAFFETLAGKYRGGKVILNGIVPPVVETAMQGLERGFEKLFAPESLFFLAGGAKGRKFPDNYRELLERFTNLPYPRVGYGMTEAASGITRMCPEGFYHLPPNLIPYLLDPDNGALFPRKGTQTGRYGFIDIGAQTRWGGFLTGDEITINWGDQSPCKCGRKGPHIVGEIRRYSELRGGDDKITCAGAPGVHDKALDFIAHLGD